MNNGTKVDPSVRFWRHVVKGEGCWPWQGASMTSGYGSFGVERGQMVGAHRYSWQIANGPIPNGMWVLHTCDNRPCVNPAHLWLGSALDNNRDAIAKGRRARQDQRGEANGRAKLALDQVLHIRASDTPAPVLALQYGVTKELVYAIRRRRLWRHVP